MACIKYVFVSEELNQLPHKFRESETIISFSCASSLRVLLQLRLLGVPQSTLFLEEGYVVAYLVKVLVVMKF
jgi:hypothetical protein